MWCNGSTLAQSAIDVGSVPTLGTLFHISITLTSLIHNQDPVQVMRSMVVEPTLYVCKAIVCMYVIVSFKKLTILG